MITLEQDMFPVILSQKENKSSKEVEEAVNNFTLLSTVVETDKSQSH